MKIRISIIIFFLLVCVGSYSQTKKGTFALSGKTDLNFLFSNTTIGTDSVQTGRIKSNQYGFTVGAGYFVADNFLVALSGAYTYLYTRSYPGYYAPVNNENITTAFTIVPQLTYYIPFEGKLRPSLTIGAGYLSLKERDTKVFGNNKVVYTLTGPSFNGAAGLSYFITKSISFDLGVQYAHNRLKNKQQTNEIRKQNIVAGNIGVSVFF